jgi:methyltransferase OMS1
MRTPTRSRSKESCGWLLLLSFLLPKNALSFAGSNTNNSRSITARCSKESSDDSLAPRREFVTTALLVLSTLPSAAVALTPQEASRQYDTYAPSYDQLDGGTASSLLGIEEARSGLLRLARGDVLEIGAGTGASILVFIRERTRAQIPASLLSHSYIIHFFILLIHYLGLNLDKYVASQISSLTLVDISEGMLAEAQARVSKTSSLAGVKVKFVQTDATSELVDRFGPESFDTVVDSFSLCTMGTEGARRCLEQVSSVVKKAPPAQVLLLENSRSSNRFLGLYQDATADAAAMAGGKGCVYNQDVGALIRGTGRLVIKKEQSFAAGLFRSFVCVRND